jgi:branched-chain amino acid transport system permease protein
MLIDSILPHIINGLVLGMLYVVLAVGLSLILGVVGVVNFSHGVFFALGAYIAYTIQPFVGYWLAFLVAVLLTGAAGMLVERGLLRRLYDRDVLSGLLLTFGLALVVEEVIRTVWGAGGLPFTPPVGFDGLVIYGPFVQTKYRLLIFAISCLVLLGLWLFIEKTRFGAIIRGGSRDPLMMRLLGVRIFRLFTLVFGLGTALAAIAGILVAPIWGLNPDMGNSAIMPAFVIVTIGGLGSIRGAVISGLLVGLVISISIEYYPPMADAAMYALMVLVLLSRPRGLLGQQWEKFE